MLWGISPGEGGGLALKGENARALEPQSVGPRGLHVTGAPVRGPRVPFSSPTTHRALLGRAPNPAWPKGQGELGGGGPLAARPHRVHPKTGPVSQWGSRFAPSPLAAHHWEWTLELSQKGQDRREPLSQVFRTWTAGHLGLSVWAGPGLQPTSHPVSTTAASPWGL